MDLAHKNSLYRLSIFQKSALDILRGENSGGIYITLIAQAAKKGFLQRVPHRSLRKNKAEPLNHNIHTAQLNYRHTEL